VRYPSRAVQKSPLANLRENWYAALRNLGIADNRGTTFLHQLLTTLG
jgi:hypothetical protein